MASQTASGGPDSEIPKQFPSVLPTDFSSEAAQTRILVKILQDSLGDLKSDVKDIKSHRHSDFVFTMSAFAAGFLLLASVFSTMLIVGYFRLDERHSKSDEKINDLAKAFTRLDTKIEDLLLRIPPVQTPAPRR